MTYKYFAIPPSATVKELMEVNGISKREIMYEFNCDSKFADEIINGSPVYTEEIVQHLENLFMIDSKFFMSLYKNYLECMELAKEMG